MKISKMTLGLGSLVLAIVVGIALAGTAMAARGHSGPPMTAPLNMGSINSVGNDFEITYSADGNTAIFASNRLGGYGGNDNYSSEFVDGAWQAPVNLGPNVNTSVNEQEASLSDDGNLLYFTRYFDSFNGDLYVSRKVDGVWQLAQSWNDVPGLPHVNTPTTEDHCPIIASPDLIYFGHDVPGVTQHSDIWKVERTDGVWGEPQSLTGGINSPYRDHLHWTGLAKDGKSMIVVSDRPDNGSQGGSDEWISRMNNKGDWSTPINLGPKVNSAANEVCWTFTPDGLKFTGNTTKADSLGSGDLYWIYANDIPLLNGFKPNAQPPINLVD